MVQGKSLEAKNKTKAENKRYNQVWSQWWSKEHLPIPGDVKFSVENILFSGSHGTFFRIDHMISHKKSFKKLERTEFKQCMLSNHME